MVRQGTLLWIDKTAAVINTANVPTNSESAIVREEGTSGLGYIYSDWVFVRPYVYPEPSTSGYATSSIIAPIASFTYTPTSGSTPLAVAFTDTSQTSITAWNWTFGAANYSSLQNPSYTFVGAGNYSVTLNVTNASGTNSTTKYVLVNSITDPNPNSMIKYKTSQSIVNIDNQTPYVGTGVITNISSNTTQVISNFTWNPAYVSISNIRINQSSVNITGLSIDSYAIHNDLGYAIVNESKASGFVAPANATFDFNITYVKYVAPGTSVPFSFDSSSEYYDVGNSTYRHFNTITGANAIIGVWGPIGANFSANATTVAVGSPLAFSDTSTGYPDAWSWDFGDGSTSTAQNPVYAYATTGLKTVALHAYMSENGTITNTITKTNYINVTAAPPPAPVADFTGTPTTVSLGTTVQFNDTSAYSPTSWSWNFGDSGRIDAAKSRTPLCQHRGLQRLFDGNKCTRIQYKNQNQLH